MSLLKLLVAVLLSKKVNKRRPTISENPILLTDVCNLRVYIVPCNKLIMNDCHSPGFL